MTDGCERAKHYMLHAMVSIAAADEALDDSETATIRRVYERVTAEQISVADILAEAEHRETSETRLAAELRGVRGELDKGTKENIIRASYLVLLADGHISAGERKQLKDFAAALDIPEVHFTAILEDLESWSD